MIFILLLIIFLLVFIHRKKSKTHYISLFILSIFSFILIQVNPDLNEKYNLRQILYLIDSVDFIPYIILCLIILGLLTSIIFDKIKKNSFRILFSFLALLFTSIILFTLITLKLFIIKEPLNNYFRGYVCNSMKNPLVDVKIIEGKSTNNYVLTDKKGFFKLRREIEVNNESSLIFIKKEYKDTTVQIKSRYDRPPPRTFLLFLRGESDTLIMTNY